MKSTLRAVAVLSGTGRGAAFRLADKLTSAGLAIIDSTGQLAGYSASRARLQGRALQATGKETLTGALLEVHR